MKRNSLVEKIQQILFLFFLVFFTGCSLHYDNGLQLEKEERWEEAAIEYRLASIENPDDSKIKSALIRVNKNVSRENFEAYKRFLKKNEFKKAYKRLDAALSQDPELKEAIFEKKKWNHILITGRIEFEFNNLFSNLRLADEMILQVKINSPNNKILTGNISSETGIFFIEELAYNVDLNKLVEYTINCIGLKIKRKSISGIIHNEFKKFVNFRDLSPIQVIGEIKKQSINKQQNILDHRPSLITNEKNSEDWYPPSLVTYKVRFFQNQVEIISDYKRNEFAPSVIYVNNSESRVSIDFGVNKLRMNESNRIWSIQRKLYRTIEDDYFYLLANNLTLYHYLFFDSVYKFFK